MATIISISLNDKILEEIDRIKDEMGFSGRSEVLRAGIRSMVSEAQNNEKLTGRIKCVLLIVHKEEAEESINEMTHSFEDIINTQVHSNLGEHKCLEIFVLDGNAERIKELIKLPQVNKKIDYMKLVVP
ncbi:CopG family ribbon-helix-helix protein [Candidatus Micrarchaeota archaeon]|nr:CopG family ribbon-helix-helix protein [Candidatus Micrarchaeota archaeon]